ncbi:MAG: formyltransferase family protein, partial [Pseudomonadota bacterium]
LVGYPFAVAWQELQKSYKTRYPTFPDVPLLRVNNINDLDSVRAIEKYAPDLVVVSGTNLVGKQIIKLASNKKGIINLHTGISPYIKGGPNCTNWCLAEQSFHLIGNTVMWLDQGIDSGNIIATEQTPLTGQETLVELHWKVMEHAHNLYIRVIKKLANGQTVPSVPQESIGKGKTFYTIEWNGWAMLKALINFRRYYSMYFLDGQEYRNQSSRLNLVLTQK